MVFRLRQTCIPTSCPSSGVTSCLFGPTTDCLDFASLFQKGRRTSFPSILQTTQQGKSALETSRKQHHASRVAEARARAQHAKLKQQDRQRLLNSQRSARSPRVAKKREAHDLLARRRARTTLACAMEEYLADHEGGNQSSNDSVASHGSHAS
ncbi:MAG TPA: hypothetical protein VFV38_12930 [Ktedonobacteraceae bacterium]|nr:hypothetical protein [Ktedonobacteraceae bacterium]